MGLGGNLYAVDIISGSQRLSPVVTPYVDEKKNKIKINNIVKKINPC